MRHPTPHDDGGARTRLALFLCLFVSLMCSACDSSWSCYRVETRGARPALQYQSCNGCGTAGSLPMMFDSPEALLAFVRASGVKLCGTDGEKPAPNGGGR